MSAFETQLMVMPRLTYIVAILNIEEAPETVSCKPSCSVSVLLDYIHRHHSIDDGEPPIKGQLCNLGSL